MTHNYALCLSILFLCLFAPAKAVVYVGNSSLPANITGSCFSALTVDIACNVTIRKLRPGLYYPESALSNICTSGCSTALESFESSVLSACVGQTYDSQTDIGYIPVYTIPQVLRYQFNLSCLTSGGQYCNVLAATAAGIASDQSNLNNGTNYGGDTDACSDCTLQTLQFEASSPYYSGEDVVSVYSTRTSSCGATGYPLSTSTFAFSVPVPTTTATPCTGKTYTIQPSDTCESISKSQGIGTSWLLSDNNLSAYCADFPNNGTLCLQNTCTTYTVKANDTCTSIASSQNITYAQVLAWNPVFDLQCSNINKSMNYEICVGAPGVQYVAPTTTFAAVTSVSVAASIPTNAANGTNTDCGQWYEAQPGDYCNLLLVKFSISLADFQFLNPEVNSNCTNLYAYESYCILPVGNINDYPGAPGYVSPTSTSNATIVAFSSLPDATYIPALYNATNVTYANGSRTDCEAYVDGSDYQMNLTGTFYDNNCQLVANTYSITLDTLGFWNPSLGNTSDVDCGFQSNQYYCVAWSGSFPTPSPAPSAAALPIRNGTISNCTLYANADIGDTCDQILNDWCITIEEFYSWNPAVGSDCSTLWLNYQYCVAGPGFVASCPSAAASTTTGSSSTSSTSASPTAPGPTQSGEPSNCNEWYIAKSGDSCSSVEIAYGITDAQFHAWNPAVSSDCSSGFWADEAYCVGISSSASSTTSSSTAAATPPGPTQSGEPSNCNRWYLAQSGDSCASVEAAYGITSAQFLAWNPAVSSDCSSGFWANEAYCVGLAQSPTSTSVTTSQPSSTQSPAPSPTQPNSIASNCNAYAEAVSGDGCESFAQEHGITAAELYEWNTVLGTDGANCGTDFWADTYYCIGVSSS